MSHSARQILLGIFFNWIRFYYRVVYFTLLIVSSLNDDYRMIECGVQFKYHRFLFAVLGGGGGGMVCIDDIGGGDDDDDDRCRYVCIVYI